MYQNRITDNALEFQYFGASFMDHHINILCDLGYVLHHFSYYATGQNIMQIVTEEPNSMRFGTSLHFAIISYDSSSNINKYAY